MPPTRRGLMAALAPVPVLPALAVEHPDGRLLALAVKFIDLAKRTKGLFGEGEYASMHVRDEKARRLQQTSIDARMDEIMDLLEDVRAKTPEGLVARARMAEAYGVEWLEQPKCVGEMLGFDLAKLLPPLLREVA